MGSDSFTRGRLVIDDHPPPLFCSSTTSISPIGMQGLSEGVAGFSRDDCPADPLDHFSDGKMVELRDQVSIFEVDKVRRNDPSGLRPPPLGDSEYHRAVSDAPGAMAPQVKASSLFARIFPPGTMFATEVNLVKLTLGTGTLGIPYAMQQAGLITFSIFLILTTLGTIYSMYLLVYALELSGMDTYELLGTHLIGRWMGCLVSILLILFCWGACTMYITAMGSILTPLQRLQNAPAIILGVWGRRFMVTVTWLLFMFPLCLPKHINSLRYSSLVGVIATVVLIVAIIFQASVDEETKFEKNVPMAVWSFNMIIALPIAFFSQGPSTNFSELFAEMNPDIKTAGYMARAVAYSMTFCTVIYIACGIAGVANFGANTKANILDNYDPVKNLYLIVPFAAITVTLFFSFPIQIFPSRDAVLQFMGYANPYITPTYIRVVVSGFLAIGALIVGMFVSQISILFGLVGSICAASVCFVFPALFILATKQWTRETVGIWHVMATWAMLVLGILCAILGTSVTIYEMVMDA